MATNSWLDAAMRYRLTMASGLCGHVLFIGPRRGSGSFIAPFAALDHGSSVPISKGKPPDRKL